MAEHRHFKGATGCPICSKHDHANREPFGFDRDHQPVPAWWFECRRCGNPDEAQTYIAEWTPAGIHHMKGAAA